jgi:hypothetical protein
MLAGVRNAARRLQPTKPTFLHLDAANNAAGSDKHRAVTSWPEHLRPTDNPQLLFRTPASTPSRLSMISTTPSDMTLSST